MKTLIIKFLSDEITEAELQKLRKWLEDANNLKTFEAYVRDSHDLNLSMSKIDMQTAYTKIWDKINGQEKSVRKLIPNWIRYAAVFVGVIGLAYMISIGHLQDKQNLDTQTIVSNIKAGTDKATLTLGDGTSVALEKGATYVAENIKSNGEDIVYNAVNNSKSDIAYNYLTIPRGGQFHVKLSDGTEVWLNSESKLKYPVNFIEATTREVELVYGEAYFDVSPSTNHNGSKFKVQTGAQEIEVLGTEFNIKAYQDENYIYTTLVEGEVLVKNTKHNNILSPNQQSIINIANNKMDVTTVDNVYNIIAWKKGVFSFKDMSLNKIMKVLSRWYDTDVIFINKEIENINFTGILGKELSIEEILSTISNTNNINYEINNKTIIFR